MLSFEQILRMVETAIGAIHFEAQPRSLFIPIEYTLSLGGKRIRPAFMLMACNLYSESVDKALKPALGMEVFHNFTLLHDDLMDGAFRRRHQPTVHEKWNPNTAILSGDAMLIIAYQLIGETDPPFLKDILTLFTQTALEICEGQQYDMEFESRQEVTEEDYIEMIRLKTAVLLACCLKTGALIGGAPKEEVEYLYRFGIHVGLAFQLQDDLLDVYGDPLTFGKNIGGDILCNKKTFLLIHAMRQASEQQRAIIRKYQQTTAKNAFTPEEKIAAITAIYDDLKMKNLIQAKIQQYYRLAMYDLSLLHLPAERLATLREVSRQLMMRES
ncbi:MAG: polyprenyl synthetase family protein [Tannerella sp.]|jgi:geranylgeranyl diphosphate synthase type II|nr:polyprenyl synthetase family protein [Tannerella sp.]